MTRNTRSKAKAKAAPIDPANLPRQNFISLAKGQTLTPFATRFSETSILYHVPGLPRETRAYNYKAAVRRTFDYLCEMCLADGIEHFVVKGMPLEAGLEAAIEAGYDAAKKMWKLASLEYLFEDSTGKKEDQVYFMTMWGRSMDWEDVEVDMQGAELEMAVKRCAGNEERVEFEFGVSDAVEVGKRAVRISFLWTMEVREEEDVDEEEEEDRDA